MTADLPWLEQYTDGDVSQFDPAFETALSMWAHRVKRRPDGVFLRYYGSALTFAQVDALSDALAQGWLSEGVAAGSRIALFLQNVPAFALSVIAGWKLGCTIVPINPMSKAKELSYVLSDCQPSVLVTHPELWQGTAARVVEAIGTSPPLTMLTDAADFASAPLSPVFDLPAPSYSEDPPSRGALNFASVVAGHSSAAPSVYATPSGDDPALLTYTSGTTGPPKGAVSTHRNIAFNAESCWRWIGLESSDSILGVAPLFHITGFVLHLTLGIFGGIPVVLTYRFDPSTMLDAAQATQPTFAVGSITAFIALLNTARSDPSGAVKLSSLRKVFSGGAPVPSSVVEEFEQEIGPYIRNVYGLTETTSAVTSIPRGRRAPVDPHSGALSVGVPMYGSAVRIADDEGRTLPASEIGEIMISGPGVIPGYWKKEAETRHAFRDGELRTGDVGFMDEQGWVYLVDRKKDMIIASGFKVWPREVEDVLYGHSDVLEAAVVGLPDEYRGETVGAFVVVRPGHAPTADDLISYCRSQMAAYKIPRQVYFVDELPKTATGKVLRRSLQGYPAGGREHGPR